MNYYLVLGVAEDADKDTIRRAFRAMVRRYHPDAGAGASSDAFRRVVEAYETLNDPARRRMYDQALHRHTVRSPQERERFVEPLGNRMEPLVSRMIGYRRPVDCVQSHIDVEEMLDTLIFDLAFWSLNRRRRF
jgi:DnaJ-class molecular chaperone